MANTAVDDLFNRWNKRTAVLRSQGATPDTYTPIFQQDYQNVLKGGAPLSDQEAQLHFFKNVTGKSAVGDKKRKTGILGTLGNIPTDIKDIASSLPKLPGMLAKEVADTGKLVYEADIKAPIQTFKEGGSFDPFSKDPNSAIVRRQEALAKAFGYKSADDLRANHPDFQDNFTAGDLLRVGSQAPIARMLPGSYTLGNLTTPEGRTRMQETPVQTALDLLPFAGKLGRVAAARKVSDPQLARTIRGGGRPARAAAAEAFGTGTVLEALGSGRPIRALSRATPLSGKLKKVAEWGGVSAEQRAMSRQATVANRAVQEVTDSAYKRYKDQFKELGFTTEDDFNTLGKTYAERRADVVYPENVQRAFKLFEDETNRLVDDPDSALYRDPSGEVRSRLNPAEKDILALTKKKEMLEERATKHTASLEIPFGAAADLEKYPEVLRTKKGNVSKRRKGEPMQEYLMRTSERARERTAGLLEKAQAQLADLESGADEVLAKRPPARFMPILADRIRESLKQWAYANLEPDAANAVVKDIDNKLDPLHGEFLLDDEGNSLINSADDAIPKKEINRIIKEHYSQWTALKEEGLDPGYLPGVTRNRAAALANPSIILDRDYAATYERGRNALGAATADNALTSLVAGAAEQAKKAHTQQFINWMHKEKHLIPGEELLSRLRQDTRAFIENNPGLDARSFEETILREGYEKFDPKAYGLTFATPGGDFYIPKPLAKTLKDLGYRDPSSLTKASNVVQGTFKRAVLFQPSFLFNNAVGNMMFAMMEADSPISAAQDAYRAFRDMMEKRKGGEGVVPNELRQGVASVDMTPPQQFQFTTGGKLRQFLNDNAGVQRAKWIERKWFGANAALDDFYRSWAYIQEFRKTGDVDKAVQYARQVYSDMDELTPIERNVIKQVIPFYSFQRHLFKFAARYPVDHPIRTQVIAAAIRQQEEEGDLPDRFKTMFWLGQPDDSGEQWRVNLRSLNPFNDFGNNLTLGGFLQNSSPLIKTPVEALGISDITGAPGYTKRGYNPESGRYEAQRDFSYRKAVGNFLPFIEKAMDEYDVQTGQAEGRYVPAREPTALRGVASVLNVPLLPRVTNVDRERYMQEKARIRDVTNAVQDVQAGRSDADLRRYQGLVPFRGQLVPVPVLAKFLADYEAALREAGYTGAPSAVTPRR